MFNLKTITQSMTTYVTCTPAHARNVDHHDHFLFNRRTRWRTCSESKTWKTCVTLQRPSLAVHVIWSFPAPSSFGLLTWSFHTDCDRCSGRTVKHKCHQGTWKWPSHGQRLQGLSNRLTWAQLINQDKFCQRGALSRPKFRHNMVLIGELVIVGVLDESLAGK